MTTEDIIKMAREAGCDEASHPMNPWRVTQESLELFANLVRDDAVKAEREACAKVCDEIVARYRHADDAPEMVAANWCADGVRARGKD
jgi:hypothetical protein